MPEPFSLAVVSALLTLMLGIVTTFLARLSKSERERASNEATEIATAVRAQAEASKARALEVLADRAPPEWSAADLLRALEMVEVPPIRAIVEPERREEERKAWTLVEDLVNSYHRQALDQAKVQFWFSILAATAGFGWVLYSAIGIDPRELVTVSKTLPGGRR